MKRYIVELMVVGLVFVSSALPAKAATLQELKATVTSILVKVNKLPSTTIADLLVKVRLLQSALQLQTQVNALINGGTAKVVGSSGIKVLQLDSTVSNPTTLLLLTSEKSQYETGEQVRFSINPSSSSASVPEERIVTVVLTKPDGVVVQQKVSIRNPRSPRYPCDPVTLPSGRNSCSGMNESFDLYFTPVFFYLGDQYLTQVGTYTLSATVNDPSISIKNYSFRVTTDRLSSIFIQSVVGDYAIKPEYSSKGKWSDGYDSYKAIYFSQSATRSDMPTEKREMVFEIGFTDSPMEKASRYGPMSVVTLHRELGNVHFSMLYPTGQYSITWPSKGALVHINGFGGYGDDEKAVVAKYLAKYPSTL